MTRKPAQTGGPPAVKRRRRHRPLDVVTYATRFPPYVFSTSGNGKLVHRVARLQLRWYWWVYEEGKTRLARQQRPHAIAECACGQVFHLGERHGTPTRVQLCAQPNPGAQLCGRCQGEPPPFGRRSAFGQLPTRKEKRRALREAHAHLVGRPFRRGRPRKVSSK
jgi:hypothetical protein